MIGNLDSTWPKKRKEIIPSQFEFSNYLPSGEEMLRVLSNHEDSPYASTQKGATPYVLC